MLGTFSNWKISTKLWLLVRVLAGSAARGVVQTENAGRDLSQMAEQFQSLVGQLRV